jgi:hypothetical protein
MMMMEIRLFGLALASTMACGLMKSGNMMTGMATIIMIMATMEMVIMAADTMAAAADTMGAEEAMAVAGEHIMEAVVGINNNNSLTINQL